MAQGLSNKGICKRLNLAEGTVKLHVTAIMRALNAANRTQAVSQSNPSRHRSRAARPDARFEPTVLKRSSVR